MLYRDPPKTFCKTCKRVIKPTDRLSSSGVIVSQTCPRCNKKNKISPEE